MAKKVRFNKDIFLKWNKGKVIYCVLMAIFLGMFIFAATGLIRSQLEYKEGVDEYDHMVDEYVSTPEPASDEEPYNDIAEEYTDSTTQMPEVKTETPLVLDYESLLKDYPNFVGWIYSEGTVINYPIVQGEDNEYYLKHLINGKVNSSGTIFIDCINNGWTDTNTIIYGHHMKNGSMFASIQKYKKQSYYDKHPTMYLKTPEQDYRIDIFSGYTTSNDSDTYIIRFSDDDEYSKYLEDVKAKSNFASNVEVTISDRIVTLSTCAYDFDNARYVLHGKLVPLGTGYIER